MSYGSTEVIHNLGSLTLQNSENQEILAQLVNNFGATVRNEVGKVRLL